MSHSPQRRRISTSIAVTLLVATTASAAQRPRNETPRQVWEHLAKQYDADKDGTITRAEYGRGDRPFANLDRNGDGALSATDFGRAGRNVPRRGGARRGEATPDNAPIDRLAGSFGDMFGSFLNVDGGAGLSKADWDALTKLLAPDSEGVIEDAALTKITQSSGPSAMGRMGGNPKRLFDHDGDGAVTKEDLAAVFAAMDKDGDGLVEQGREIDLPPGVGEVAPDFTLPMAEDRKTEVTLSSFRGKQPVALIFGSYT